MEFSQATLLDYFRSLFNESDRGCVLLVASFLDESLKSLHQSHIQLVTPNATKLHKRLFESHAPLSTFAARIQLGYVYGLLRPETYADLERHRHLRNDVAHSYSPFSFKCPQVQKAVFALKPSTSPNLTDPELQTIQTPDKSERTAKLYFVLSAMSLGTELLSASTSVLEAHITILKSIKSHET
ncbi:MAG: hypothetical protein IT581_11040 [Verrucomicrobiales bacterium]|nr:hypothetical protein [Verrucomicrobiales bacterium]